MTQDSSQTSLSLLYEISRQLVSSLELKTVLARVLTISVENVGAERGMLIVLDEEQNPTDAAIVYQGRLLPYTQQELEGILHQGLAGWVLRSHETALIPDTSQDARWLHRPDDDVERSGPKSAICTPILWAGDQLVGVVTIVHPHPGFFNEQHLKLLQTIADQAAIAIYNARLYQSLQVAHRRYRELFEESIDPILISDWHGRIIEANRMALRACGYEAAQLKQRSVIELHDPDWDVLGKDFEQIKSGSRTITYESNLRCHETGKIIPIEVHVYKVTINGEDHLQWIFRDISERKQLQTLQDELFAMVYHDLRSPLSNVVSSLDLIKSMLPQENQDILEPVVNIALRSTERVKRLANSLLDINRLEAGQTIVDLKEVRIGRLVNEALEIIKPNAEARQLNVKKQVPDGLPSIVVDEDMIRRVLINLLENAVKYTPINGEILVGCADEENSLIRLWVQDSGSGIPQEAREMIFDKFTRLPVKDAPRGIGLGLAFCRLAVEAHGGKIWAEANEPHGSRLVFTLPVKKP